MNPPDDGIAPVRTIRHEISRQFGHDIRRYLDYLRGQESRYAHQIDAYRDAHPTDPKIKSVQDHLIAVVQNVKKIVQHTGRSGKPAILAAKATVHRLIDRFLRCVRDQLVQFFPSSIHCWSGLTHS